MIDRILFSWPMYLFLIWLLVIAVGNLWPRTKCDTRHRAKTDDASKAAAIQEESPCSLQENQLPAKIRIYPENKHAAGRV
jgi:hypothetical protein